VASPISAVIVAAARSRIGDPYVWGAAGPHAFDCSGLCVWAYAQAGVTIPRTSQQQCAAGIPVHRDELQPADIVVYYSDASHVALYSGNGMVVEASTYGVPVKETPLDDAGPYLCSRRFVPQENPTMTTLFGPDVSNNNWSSDTQVTQFVNSLPGQGFSWLEAKCTQGSGYQDPYWGTTLQACQAINFPVIAYHYVTTDDPTAQARNFAANGGGAAAMLDFEAGSGDITNFWAVVNAFNAAGIAVVLSYVPQWYWAEIGSPDLSNVPGLIASAYPSTAQGYASSLYEAAGGASGEGWAPYGGATPVIWQFTDAANVGGVIVDCNAFQGTVAQLQQLLNPTPAPAPVPAPPIPTPSPTPGVFMALTDQQQADLYNAIMGIAALVSDNNTQLRGPNQQGWPQLGQNAAGQNLTVVDALASVKQTIEGTKTNG
jgi:GH25 family lysozyme M1 (1,4-beta-N-acetylmuramidase)